MVRTDMNTIRENETLDGEDEPARITLSDKPLIRPDENSQTVLVIGGGVTGLVTSWLLLDKGYKVIIVAREWATWTKAQRIPSQIAGALWEYPPAVCGQHVNPISLARSRRWCMISYHIWRALAEQDPSFGSRMKKSSFFFPKIIEQDHLQLQKMENVMKAGIIGFRRDAAIIAENGVDPNYGVVDAYEFLVPIIDTDQGMIRLMELVQQKGARLITSEIRRDLLEMEDELLEEFDADIIVNATGLSGTWLANDSTCYPSRGCLIRVINDGKDFPKVQNALSITAHAAKDNEIVFIVPRNDNILILGGIAQPHKSLLNLTMDAPVIKKMRARCEAFLPALKNARVDPDYPLAQGLRPTRQRNIRVERELRPRLSCPSEPSRIVHNYGHGGAGWSLSFGCAADVLVLIEEALSGAPPSEMTDQKPRRRRRRSMQTGSRRASAGIIELPKSRRGSSELVEVVEVRRGAHGLFERQISGGSQKGSQEDLDMIPAKFGIGPRSGTLVSADYVSRANRPDNIERQISNGSRRGSQEIAAKFGAGPRRGSVTLVSADDVSQVNGANGFERQTSGGSRRGSEEFAAKFGAGPRRGSVTLVSVDEAAQVNGFDGFERQLGGGSRRGSQGLLDIPAKFGAGPRRGSVTLVAVEETEPVNGVNGH